MKIEIDAATLRTYMNLWRKTIDMEVPLFDELKIHVMVERQSILEGFIKIADAWLMIFNARCQGLDEASRKDLEALIGDIREFETWAQNGLVGIKRLGSVG